MRRQATSNYIVTLSPMKSKITILVTLFVVATFIFTSAYISTKQKPPIATNHAATKRYLYVAVPGIRDYLGYGGHGNIVFGTWWIVLRVPLLRKLTFTKEHTILFMHGQETMFTWMILLPHGCMSPMQKNMSW